MSRARSRVHAALALGPLVVLLALAHAMWRRGEAYALLDVLVRGDVLLAAAGTGVAVGALAGARVRPGPLLTFAALLGAAAVLPGANVGAFVWTSHTRSTGPVLAGLGVLSGGVWAFSVVVLVRWLARVAWWGEGLVQWLSLDGAVVVVVALAVVVGVGGRAGALRFPSLLGGLLAGIAWWGIGLVTGARGARALRSVAAGLACALLVATVAVSGISPVVEATRLGDPIVSGFGDEGSRVSVTSGRGAIQVFEDGMLRLSSIDVHRRREALAHPALLAAPSRARVLLLGGGDGTTLREILRYPDVVRVTVVEPDAAWLEAGRRHPVLRWMNGDALSDPRVTLVRSDLFAWIREGQTDAPPEPKDHDVILLDLAEPETPAHAKMYSVYAFHIVAGRLADRGVLAVNLPSPEAQHRAFASGLASLGDALPFVVPYAVDLPTAGVVGFALAAREPLHAPKDLPPGLLYLDPVTLPGLFALSRDEGIVTGVQKNLLYEQVLVKYRDEDEPR